MSEEQTPGTHAQRCFAAAWRVAEQMGRIVGDEVRQPFAACLMVSSRTGDADRVVIAPESELSTLLSSDSSALLGHVLASVGQVERTR